MASQNEILEAAVNELRKRREQLDRTKQGLEAELGISNIAQTATSPTTEGKPVNAKSIDGSDLMKMVYEGQFFNKSQTQAAKDLLNMVRRPLKTPIISEVLNKSGMKVHIPSLYTAFNRSPDFVLVLPNTWGLKEWYPDGVKSMRVEKRAKRRGPKRKVSKSRTGKLEEKTSKSTEP